MIYNKGQAQSEFTRWSESYDRSLLQWLLFGPSHSALIRRIQARHGDAPIKILDVGCGTGVLAAKIREKLPNARIWGVDLTAGMLAKGSARWRKNAGHVAPIQGDSERLPFAEGSFDVVTCANSFHHYPDQARAVAEMHRVLNPGGRLMLIDGFRDRPYGWFIYDVCVAGLEGAVLHASRRRVRDLFASAGFAATSQKIHHGFAPFLFSEGVAATTSAVPAPHLRRSRSSQTVGRA